MTSAALKTEKKAKGAFGNIIQTGCEKVVSLLLLAYLARVLPAEVFGFTAAFMVFVEVGSMLSSSGTTASLITLPHLNKNLIDTLFTASALFGLCFFLIFLLFADQVSLFFNFRDQGMYLSMVTSIMFIQGLGAVPKALMSRSLRFFEISKISFVSSVVGSLTSALITFTPFSFYSLFFFYFIQSLVSSFLFFRFCPFVPKLSFNFTILKQLSFVSLPATASGFFGMLTDKLVPLSIGKWLGPVDLGLFSLALRPCAVVWQVLVSSFQRICLPIISASQKSVIDDRQLAKFLLPVFLFIFPILFFIFCNSERIIFLLFGDNFKSASPLLSLAASSLFFLSLSYVGEALFLSSRKPSDLYWTVLFRFVLVVFVLFLTLGFGLFFILVGLNICNIITTSFIFLLLFKQTRLNFLKSILLLKRLFLFLLTFSGIFYAINFLSSSFVVNLLFFCIFYLLFLSFYFRMPLFSSPVSYLNCLFKIFD